MKKSVMFLFCLLCVIMSCNKTDITPVDDPLCESRIILQGDFVDITSFPLTKSFGKIYYAFEIDSIQVKINPWSEFHPVDTSYIHYCGGVFEDIKNLSVNLEKKHRYRIRCSIIENLQDQIYVDNGYIYEPFTQDTKAEITNSFIYGGTKKVYAYTTYNYIRTLPGDNNRAAKVNRYYGEVETDVIEDNSAISLELERRNFGIRFLINPPKEGTLIVSQQYDSPKFEYSLNSESSTIDEEYFYALGLRNDSRTLDLKVTWTREDNSIVDLSPGKIKFYNKTMTTIKVDVNDRVGNSDIDINLDPEMSKDEIEIK